jgi:T-complex protein 1 subunit alpha
MALKEACKFIADQQAVRVDTLPKDALLQCAKTALSSKVLGAGGLIRPSTSSVSGAGIPTMAPVSPAATSIMPTFSGVATATPLSFEDHFAQMAVDAMQLVRRAGPKGEPRYPVSAVHILKAHGQSQLDSQLIQGYALNCSLASPCKSSRPLFRRSCRFA